MDELEPCPNPWCDRPNGLRVSLIDDEWRVNCRCNLVGPGEKGNTRGQAIAAWNTRANHHAHSDVVEAACNMALRSAVFDVLRRHDVSEQCFAEHGTTTHARMEYVNPKDRTIHTNTVEMDSLEES